MVDRAAHVTRNPLISKLEHFTRLSAEDEETLEKYCGATVRRVDPQKDIVEEGEAPEALYLMLDGWACRYKLLEDGRRQIVAFFLPGDLYDLNIFVLCQMDHSIGTLTPATLSVIGRHAFESLMLESPRVTQSLL